MSCISVFLNQLQPYTSMIADTVNYFMLKQRTSPTYYCQLLPEVHIWNGLASETTVTNFAKIVEKIEVDVTFFVFMDS